MLFAIYVLLSAAIKIWEITNLRFRMGSRLIKKSINRMQQYLVSAVKISSIEVVPEALAIDTELKQRT